VLGAATGYAAAAVGLWRGRDGTLVATVRLVVVHPGHRRLGLGRGLLDAVEQWARQQDADRLELGGAAPFSLWSGVEPQSELEQLAASSGFGAGEEVRSYAVPSDFRADPPEHVMVRRAVHDADAAAVTRHVAENWPHLSDEVSRALEHGTCHAALDTSGGEVLGIGCHSVTRAALVGPLLVRATHRRQGIGQTLLGQICRDLMIADFREAQAEGVASDEVVAFLQSTGARPTGNRRPMVKDLRS
jgi:GNAT superfamily N-acetyltransferase